MVNAFVLAFLLFGPGRGSTAQASTPSGDPAAVQEGNGTEGDADYGEDSDYEDGESENSDEAYTSHNTNRLDVDGVVKKIMGTDYVKEELEGRPHAVEA